MKLFLKLFLTITTGLLLGFQLTANASGIFKMVPAATNPEQKQAIDLVKTYYTALDDKDMNQFFSLMDPNVVHEINQSAPEKGVDKFKDFMKRTSSSFNEKFDNIVILVSDDGKHAAAEWVDHGTYFKDYLGMDVGAHNQKYALTGAHFFEIRDGKIARVTSYYNMTNFAAQIRKIPMTALLDD